jgi:tRNA pseudouridine55 synthase
MASGLLVLLIGRATRLSRYVTDLDKTYLTTAVFGASSDTLDAEGEITPLDTPIPTEEEIRSNLPDFTGDVLQIPPMASAVKVGGERLYEIYRRGQTVERERRPAKIHALELLHTEDDRATFSISCSSGTYVRTLVSDLAHRLGTDAYLSTLTRTSTGHFFLQDASKIEELTPEILNKRIIPANRVVSHLQCIEVEEEEKRIVCNGGSKDYGIEGRFRVECGDELLAIYKGGRPEVVLCGG